MQFAVCSLLCAVCSVQCTVYSVKCKVLHVQSRTKTGEMWTVTMSGYHMGTSYIIGRSNRDMGTKMAIRSLAYSVQCILYSVRFIVCNLQCVVLYRCIVYIVLRVVCSVNRHRKRVIIDACQRLIRERL